MANHISAVQQLRRSQRRRELNRKNKSALRSHIRKLREAIKNKDKDTAQELLPATMSLIDRSVKKGAIHANRGSRYKSRLSRQVAQITPSSSK